MSVCPGCGRCSHCGHPRPVTYPYWTQPQWPSYPSYSIIYGSNTSTSGLTVST